MRKILISLIVALFSTSLSSAASYRGFFDGKFGFVPTDYAQVNFGFSTSHGLQFNPHIYIGLGVGYTYRYTYYEEHSSEYSGGSEFTNIFKVFADLRYDLNVSKGWSPFADLKIGYCKALEIGSWDYLWELHKNKRASTLPISFFNPTIGVRLKLSRVCGLNFGIGYSPLFFKENYFDEIEKRDVTEKLTAHAIYLNIGVDF